MIQSVAKIVIVALALLAVAYVVPGIAVASIWTALVAALILSLLNLIVRPILIVLTLPVTILTLGLFLLVLNGLLFLLAASFVEGFSVSGLLPAIVGSVLVSAISAVAAKVIS